MAWRVRRTAHAEAQTQVRDWRGNCIAGSAKRLDRGKMPGPFHKFTVSRSGRDSLRGDDRTSRHGLSYMEMGTFVHRDQPRPMKALADLVTALTEEDIEYFPWGYIGAVWPEVSLHRRCPTMSWLPCDRQTPQVAIVVPASVAESASRILTWDRPFHTSIRPYDRLRGLGLVALLRAGLLIFRTSQA